MRFSTPLSCATASLAGFFQRAALTRVARALPRWLQNKTAASADHPLNFALAFGACIPAVMTRLWEALGRDPLYPTELEGIEKLRRKVTVMPADIETIKQFIADHAIR